MVCVDGSCCLLFVMDWWAEQGIPHFHQLQRWTSHLSNPEQDKAGTESKWETSNTHKVELNGNCCWYPLSQTDWQRAFLSHSPQWWGTINLFSSAGSSYRYNLDVLSWFQILTFIVIGCLKCGRQTVRHILAVKKVQSHLRSEFISSHNITLFWLDYFEKNKAVHPTSHLIPPPNRRLFIQQQEFKAWTYPSSDWLTPTE